MLLRKWEDLPITIRNDKVKPYYDSLQKKKVSLICKIIFDRVLSLLMLVGLAPVFAVLAILIKLDSDGEVFFRQVRVTQYGKLYRIYKFRTMIKNAEDIGTQVTTNQDMRVTKIGKKLRGCRLDELPQLVNILKGEMSFVGTRPEVVKYVNQYTEEMMATLLLPAGVTSGASIKFKDEEKLLNGSFDVDATYIKEVLPKKMKWNLYDIIKFSFLREIVVMVNTVMTVTGFEVSDEKISINNNANL